MKCLKSKHKTNIWSYRLVYRLEESKNRNLRLQEDLRLARRECESLKQRFEEEALGKERERFVLKTV